MMSTPTLVVCQRRRRGQLSAAPVILAFDSFDREDGALGVADSGHVWQSAENFAILSNKARCGQNFSVGTYFDIPGESDVEVAVSLVDNMGGADRSVGLVARRTDWSNYFRLVAAVDALALIRIQAGSATTIASDPYVPVPSDRIALRAKAASLIAYVNGAPLFEVTSSFNQAAVGIGLFGNNMNQRYDDLLVTRAA